MKRPFFITAVAALMTFLVVPAHAQDGDDNLPPSGAKPDTIWFSLNGGTRASGFSGEVRPVTHSLYDHVEVLDQHGDSSCLGLIYDGTYYDIRVMLAQPMEQQFKQLVARLTDSTADKDILILQLLRFTIFSDDRQYASLRMNMYTRSPSGYQELAGIDTTFSVASGTLGQHSKKIIPLAGAVLSSTIERALSQRPATDADRYTREEILSIDYAKKIRLPLYKAGDSLPDGVYIHSKSFLHLQPEYTRWMIDTTAGWERANVFVSTPQTPSELVAPEQIYAFVKNGRPWVSVNGRYQRLSRNGLDYYTISRIKVESQRATDMANAAGWALLLASSLHLPLVQISGLLTKKKFVMQLDYRNGQFVPVRPVD